MPGLEDLGGANILQQVDVSEIFKSLAMGIATAQQALDDNSISQLQRLSETELAGKSLLELGFVPAFYSFTYADISASINLKVAEKSSLELGVSAGFDFASGSASEGDFSDLSKEHEFHSEKEEFKSNRKFSMKASSTKRIKVNNQYYQLNESEGCVKKFESLHTQLLADEKIDRVNMQYSKAYTTVFEEVDNYSVLVLTDLSSTANNVTAPSAITIAGQSFITIFNAFSGNRYGFFGFQVHVFATTLSLVDLEFFFDTDRKLIDFTYDLNLKGVPNKDKIFEALATVLKNDPSLSLTIEGYTDRSAGTKYNENLSNERCINMRNWLVARGANPTQITTTALGEKPAETFGNADETSNADFRKVKMTLTANRYYIFFVTDISGVLGSGPNIFINIATATTPTFMVINGNAAGFVAGTSISTYESLNASSSLSLFQSETKDNLLYLLDKQTEVTYMAYSEESEEINISAEEGSTEEIKVYQNENSKERIKNIATKNNSNKSFAASASIDFRMSRQFEMSMEGSASMTAHLVAVPPPDEFKLHIATVFNP